MTNEANQPNSEEDLLRKATPIFEAEADSPKNDRPANLEGLTNTSQEPEKVRKLFIPDVETQFTDSPKNDRPADLDNFAEASEETGKVRKPVEINQLIEKDDPRSPKNTERGSEG